MTRTLLIAALLAAACGRPTEQPATKDSAAPHKAAPPLVATVSTSGMTAAVLLVNRSAGPVVMPGQVLDSAQLLLEVRDAKGHVVPPMPPPTPNGELRSIAAGDRLTRSLALDVFSPRLPAGDYTVRVIGDNVESNVAPLHVP